MLNRIRQEFGDDVARIVETNSDSETDPKPPWGRRKTEYLEAIAHKQPDELRVSLADKLHNARAILLDYRTLGEPFWDRFRTGAGRSVRWYYRELHAAFSARADALGEQALPALGELGRTIEEIERLAVSDDADGRRPADRG